MTENNNIGKELLDSLSDKSLMSDFSKTEELHQIFEHPIIKSQRVLDKKNTQITTANSFLFSIIELYIKNIEPKKIEISWNNKEGYITKRISCVDLS